MPIPQPLARPSEAQPHLRRVDAWLFSDYLRAEQRYQELGAPDLGHQDHWLNGPDGQRPRGPANLTGADQALFQGILNQNLEQAQAALDDGADPNASWSDLTWSVRDRVVPLTPLGVALWMGYEHSDHLPGSVVRDEDGAIVKALLAAGAQPDATTSRRFLQDDDHPAFHALEQAVLDHLAQGEPLPGTLWTAHDRYRWSKDHPSEIEDDVLPATGFRAPHLWLHRAIEHGRPDAVDRWFALGGVPGTGGGASALANLWDVPMTRLAQEVPKSWEPMLNTVRQHLLRDPSNAVFRKEVLRTLEMCAGHAGTFEATDPVMVRCQTWVRDLLRERPLTGYQLMDPEIWALDLSGPRARVVSDMLRTLENDHLQQVANDQMPTAPVLPRARL